MNNQIEIRAWDTENNKFVDCDDHQIRQINNDYGGLGNRYVYEFGSGRLDKDDCQIWGGDIVKYAVKKKICPKCASRNIESNLEYSISKFCKNL